MANPAVDVGTGITLTFGTTSWAPEIVEVTPPGSSRESLDTSHQATTTYKTFEPSSLVDNGELSLTVHFDPSKAPPIANVAETITMAFPSAAAWDFSGFMTSFDPQGMYENVMVANVTIKVSGSIDRDASS